MADTTPTSEPESIPDLTEPLATRFQRDASVGVLGHPIVAAVIGLLVRGDTGDMPAIIAFAVISVATLLRVGIHRSSLRLRSDPTALGRRLSFAMGIWCCSANSISFVRDDRSHSRQGAITLISGFSA